MMKTTLHITTLAAAMCLASTARAEVMTFNNPGQIEIDNVTQIATYTEGAFKITGNAADFLTISDALLGFASAPLHLKAASGGAFSLLSLERSFFDLGLGETPGQLTLVGLLNGLQVASAVLPLGATLAAFNFGNPWANVSDVSFTSTSGFLLDNINVRLNASVPEPGTWALAMVALLGLSGSARRRLYFDRKR